MTKKLNQFPIDGFVRAFQIIGDSKKGITPFLPISRAEWWRGVKEGRYPSGIKLSERVTVWRAEEIRAMVELMSEGGE